MEALGISLPVFTFTVSFCGFIMTLKVAKILRNIFLMQDHPLVQIRQNHKTTYSGILKKVTPLYGLCSYNSIQYQMPPIAHIYLFLFYISTLWSMCIGTSGFTEQFNPILALSAGFVSTLLSIAICILFYSAFISSYNRKQIQANQKDGTFIQQQKTVISTSKTEKIEISSTHGKMLEILLLLTMAVIAICSLFAISVIPSQTSDSITAGLFNFLLALTLDLPIRMLSSAIFTKWKFIPIYQQIFAPLQVHLSPLDLPRYGKAPSEDDSRSVWPQMSAQNSLPLIFPFSKQRSPIKLSPIKEIQFSPVRRDKTELMVSYDEFIQRLPDDQDLHIEEMERGESDRTLASHNEESLDQIILTPSKFYNQPTAQTFIQQISPSPVKNTSPLKVSPLKNSPFKSPNKEDFRCDNFRMSGKENEDIFTLYRCASGENIEEEELPMDNLQQNQPDYQEKIPEKKKQILEEKQIQQVPILVKQKTKEQTGRKSVEQDLFEQQHQQDFIVHNQSIFYKSNNRTFQQQSYPFYHKPQSQQTSQRPVFSAQVENTDSIPIFGQQNIVLQAFQEIKRVTDQIPLLKANQDQSIMLKTIDLEQSLPFPIQKPQLPVNFQDSFQRETPVLDQSKTRPPRAGIITKKQTDVIQEFNQQREIQRANSLMNRRKTSKEFYRSQSPIASKFGKYRTNEVIQEGQQLKKHLFGIQDEQVVKVNKHRIQVKKRSRRKKRGLNPYNENLSSILGSNTPKEEEIKLDDGKFVKKQKRKIQSISSVYGSIRPASVQKKIGL